MHGIRINMSITNVLIEHSQNILVLNFPLSLQLVFQLSILSLLVLYMEHKNEVIVFDLTWMASSAPISYVKAIPAFKDVQEKA